MAIGPLDVARFQQTYLRRDFGDQALGRLADHQVAVVQPGAPRATARSGFAAVFKALANRFIEALPEGLTHRAESGYRRATEQCSRSLGALMGTLSRNQHQADPGGHVPLLSRALAEASSATAQLARYGSGTDPGAILDARFGVHLGKLSVLELRNLQEGLKDPSLAQALQQMPQGPERDLAMLVVGRLNTLVTNHLRAAVQAPVSAMAAAARDGDRGAVIAHLADLTAVCGQFGAGDGPREDAIRAALAGLPAADRQAIEHLLGAPDVQALSAGLQEVEIPPTPGMGADTAAAAERLRAMGHQLATLSSVVHGGGTPPPHARVEGLPPARTDLSAEWRGAVRAGLHIELSPQDVPPLLLDRDMRAFQERADARFHEPLGKTKETWAGDPPVPVRPGWKPVDTQYVKDIGRGSYSLDGVRSDTMPHAERQAWAIGRLSAMASTPEQCEMASYYASQCGIGSLTMAVAVPGECSMRLPDGRSVFVMGVGLDQPSYCDIRPDGQGNLLVHLDCRLTPNMVATTTKPPDPVPVDDKTSHVLLSADLLIDPRGNMTLVRPPVMRADLHPVE